MRIVLLVAVLATILVGVWWSFFRSRPDDSSTNEDHANAPSDPRLAYSGPIRNINPAVQYVGDAMCVECHEEIHETYRQHPMGRSLVPIAELADKQPYDAEHKNPFTAFGIQFEVDRRQDRVFHRQSQLDETGKKIYDFAHGVDYAIGSGLRGHSYLTCRDGYVFQTPISWFAEKDRWDLSPGFARYACVGRPVTAECLFCHTNRIEPVEGTRNRYQEPIFHGHAIGCERCHGPGELHVQSSQRDDIVNPARLEPALREAVCQQCHLEGATRVLRRGRELNEFRPGMPLEDFWRVYIRGPGTGPDNKAVNHVEQMYESLCFQRSPRGELGCTSCHNPHAAVAAEQRVDHYREACLRCHHTIGCSVPEETRRAEQPDDSCIACHMPRAATSDIAHVAATDHRIVRQRGEEPQNRRGQRPSVPLLDFFRGAPDLTDVSQARDLGVGLYQMSLRGMPLTDGDADFIVRLLNGALQDWPDDLDAWKAKGKILQTVKRPQEAVAAFEELLKRSPHNENALVSLAQLQTELHQRDQAIHYWRQVIEVSPYVAEYYKNLALLLAEQKSKSEFGPICQRWLELDPGNLQARRLWIEHLLEEGRRDEAQSEFGKLQSLDPLEAASLEQWFKERIRATP